MAAKLTPKGAATRHRIIQAASAEIRENGVTATLDDIRARTGASKSQLFHYFPEGREQLLPLAVARYEADRVLADQQPQLGELTSWASWLDGGRGGRPLPRAGSAVPAQRAHHPARAGHPRRPGGGDRADGPVAGRDRRVRQVHAGGRRDLRGLDPVRTAAAIIAGIQGGVVMLMSTGDTTPLESALDLSIAYLQSTGQPLIDALESRSRGFLRDRPGFQGSASFRVALEGGHRSHVLPFEAADDRPPQRAQDKRHRDVQDQPPGHHRATVLLLQRVMDMHLDRFPHLLDVNNVVEIERAGRLESRDRAPPVFSLLIRLAVVIAAAQPDGVGVDVGGAAERGRPGSSRP